MRIKKNDFGGFLTKMKPILQHTLEFLKVFFSGLSFPNSSSKYDIL